MVAGVVAEELVAWPAELVAAHAVVVLVAGDADLEVELRHGAVVPQRLPLPVWVDHARVDRLLDDLTSCGSEKETVPFQRRGERAPDHNKVLTD